MEVVEESIMKASALAAGILLIGLLIGMQVDDARTNFLEEQIGETTLRSQTFVVTNDYLSNSANFCRVVDDQIPKIAEENAQIGNDLQSFSGKSLSNKKKYDIIKKRYYVSQLRLYNMLGEYNSRCKENITRIFFFFDGSVQSQRQGAVLTEYRRKVDNRTYVFSYNTNAENSTVLNVLKTDYNVTEAPTIVINGKKKFERYVPLVELRQVIG